MCAVTSYEGRIHTIQIKFKLLRLMVYSKLNKVFFLGHSNRLRYKSENFQPAGFIIYIISGY